MSHVKIKPHFTTQHHRIIYLIITELNHFPLISEQQLIPELPLDTQELRFVFENVLTLHILPYILLFTVKLCTLLVADFLKRFILHNLLRLIDQRLQFRVKLVFLFFRQTYSMAFHLFILDQKSHSADVLLLHR